MLVLKIRVVYKAGMKSLGREPGTFYMLNKCSKKLNKLTDQREIFSSNTFLQTNISILTWALMIICLNWILLSLRQLLTIRKLPQKCWLICLFSVTRSLYTWLHFAYCLNWNARLYTMQEVQATSRHISDQHTYHLHKRRFRYTA